MSASAQGAAAVISPDPPGAPVSSKTLNEAIAWQLRLGSGVATAADGEAFERWVRATADNSRAWRQLDSLDADLRPAESKAGRAALVNAAPSGDKRGRVRKSAAVLAFALLVGAAAVLVDTQLPLAGLLADYSTRTGERRSVTLPDRTLVLLNTRSAIDVAFDARRRAVILREGEIRVETAHGNPAETRPFLVVTDEGSMRALGTRFLVRRLGGGTLLTVLQSAVGARAAEGGDERVVQAGETATIHRSNVEGPQAASPDADAWTDGMLVVDNVRLAEVATELARYRSGRLTVDARVADLRVTGTFPLTDPELALAALTRGLPIRVSGATRWWITLEPAAGR